MAISPMMKHYLETKEKYKDCILFYRLGDFYEMFFEDAIKASKLINLTLTGKDCGLNERAPMCGIPYHAANTYISKLVEMGEKVAICEQLTLPEESKGLVERDVIRVVSAGTIIDDNQLDEKTNNYILSCYKKNKNYGLAYTDITTGEFFCYEFLNQDNINSVVDEITRLSPAEIICNQEIYLIANELPLVKNKILPHFACYNEWVFATETAEKILKEQFSINSLEVFNIENYTFAISASGALIEYLKDTQKHSLLNINSIKYFSKNNYMALDYTAIRNLEITKTLKDGNKYGSLLWLLDKTNTGMGARKLNFWLLNPLLNINAINYRLDGVDELFNNNLIRLGLIDTLKNIKDIERLAGKISNNNINPRDCIALSLSLSVIPNIKFQLSGLSSKILKDIYNKLQDFNDIVSLINIAINDCPPINTKDGGIIKIGYNKELDELRNIGSNGKNIIAKIENDEREKTGIKNLKVGYNRVFGYFIEVTNSFKDLVPYNYVRRQTLANAERYITDELKETEEKILGSEEKCLKIENFLFNEIKEILSNKISLMQKTAEAIAILDCLLSFAIIAKQNSYIKPILLDYNENMNILDGRHPVVEALSKEKFVANNAFINNTTDRTLIITGPNMAGKSTFMRQIAIIVLMAHIGSFVPAKKADIVLTDRIFTRVGASDNLINNQSTFMVEMTEVSSIVLNATKNSLIILDEVGRGTSTFDGLSIAWAVLEYINNKIKAKTLFATHYHELTELEGKIEGIKNYKITVKEFNNSIIFLRKIARGGANKSFGIEVASLAGINKEITSRAKQILKLLENSDISTKKDEISENTAPCKSEALNILNEIDIDEITPIQAFNILNDLIKKVK